MKKEIEDLLEKAGRSLRAAKTLYKEGDYDFAVSRAYYAIFYVSEALLLNKEKSFSKHSAVISGIFEHYVKTGELPTGFHKTLSRAFRLRQKGDYLSVSEVAAEEAQDLLKAIQYELKVASNLLKD